jgi:hypothetical protein
MTDQLKRTKKDPASSQAVAQATSATGAINPTPGDALGLLAGIRRNFGVAAYGPVLTPDRFNRPSQACLFDGVDDYLEVPSDPLLALPRFSVLVTFKMLGLPIGGKVVATQQAGPYVQHRMTLVSKKDSYAIKVIREGGASYGSIKVDIGGWKAIYRSLYILPERYYQVALAYADGAVQLFVDGALKLEQAGVQAPPANSEPLLVGRMHATDYPEYFHGTIDEICFFDRPLSAEEAARLFQPGMPEVA